MKHQFDVHKVENPGTKYQLKCQLCPMSFNFEYQHERLRHKSVLFGPRGATHTCVFAQVVKRQLMLCKYPSQVHVTPRRLLCNICDQVFSSGKFLLCHVRKQHDTRSFKCHKCGNTFLKSKHLQDHRRVHKGKRRFNCGSCQMEFTKRFKLISHELSHSVHTETAF